MGTPEDECDGAAELAAACMTIRVASMLRRGLTKEGEKARRDVWFVAKKQQNRRPLGRILSERGSKRRVC